MDSLVVRITAGASTLGASAKRRSLQAHIAGRDTLVGRKTELWLTPLITADLNDFNRTDIYHRLLHGGLPPFFLEAELPEPDFQEWIDAYWAKDIQELFRLERRFSFTRNYNGIHVKFVNLRTLITEICLPNR